MHNIDTMELAVNFRKYTKVNTKNGNSKRKLDLNYIKPIGIKFRKKLHYDGEYKKEILYKGSFDGYNFCYNTKWNALTIEVPHEKVERYTASEILNNVTEVIAYYFGIDKELINNNYTLTRIDIKNDVKCENIEKINIIKNIIKKAPDRIGKYKKETLQDDVSGYTVKYINRKSNDESSNYIEITIYDKEKETEQRLKNGNSRFEELERYRGIVRIEVKFKNRKIK